MNTTDPDIIKQMASDPEKGFKLLVTAYSAPVYRHIRRMVISHHDAEDATQEVFVRIFKSIHTLRNSATLRSWIYRIATNEALRTIGQRKDHALPLDCEETNRLAGDTYIDWSDIEAVKLKRAILSLPPKQQAAFNLRYYDELGYDEIAEVLQSTPANVKANYHHAKERIIKYMNALIS